MKNVWDGKTLPFPVLLDPTFKTWETFGIDGLGTTILIDPRATWPKATKQRWPRS